MGNCSNDSGDAWALYPRTRHVTPKLKALLDFLGERLRQDVRASGDGTQY